MTDVNFTQDYVIKKANSTYIQHEKWLIYEVLKIKLAEAWQATLIISMLDMEEDFRINRFNKNREALRGLCSQLNVTTSNSIVNSTIEESNPIPASNSKKVNIPLAKNNDNAFEYLPIIIIVISTLIGASIGGSDDSAAGGGLGGFLTGCVIASIVSWLNKLSK